MADDISLKLIANWEKKRLSFKVCHKGNSGVISSLHWSDDNGRIKRIQNINNLDDTKFSEDEPVATLPFAEDFEAVVSASSPRGLKPGECIKVKLRTKAMTKTLLAVYSGALRVGAQMSNGPSGSFVSDCAYAKTADTAASVSSVAVAGSSGAAVATVIGILY